MCFAVADSPDDGRALIADLSCDHVALDYAPSVNARVEVPCDPDRAISFCPS